MFTVPVIAAVFVFRWALCCALYSCVMQLVWCTRELVPVPALLESHALSACVAPDREALHSGAGLSTQDFSNGDEDHPG